MEPIADVATGFDRATQVRSLGDGRFAGEVDTRWSAPTGPNGGYLAAIAVRAFEAGVDPDRERRLRSITCHYLRPAAAGEIVFDVELVRSGRRFSSARLTGHQDGREVMLALAAFSGDGLECAGTWAPQPPAVAPAPSADAGMIALADYRYDADGWIEPLERMPPIVHQVRIAPRLGGQPFSGRELAAGEAPQAGGWIRLPEPRPLDAAYLALCSDVWWPPAFEPLDRPALAPTVDLTIHVRAPIPPGGLPDQPVLGAFHTAAALDGLMEEDGAIFGADGSLLAQSRQLALLAPIG